MDFTDLRNQALILIEQGFEHLREPLYIEGLLDMAHLAELITAEEWEELKEKNKTN